MSNIRFNVRASIPYTNKAGERKYRYYDCGSAFQNEDGGFRVLLDMVPTDAGATLYINPPRPQKDDAAPAEAE